MLFVNLPVADLERSTAFFTINAGNTQQVFDEQAKGLLAQPGSSVALVDTSSVVPRVVFATGADLHAGQPLPAPLDQFAARSSTALSASLVRVGGKTLLAVSAAPTTNPKVVTLSTTQLHPEQPTPNRSGPYARV